MSAKNEIKSESRASVEHEICVAYNSSMNKLEMFWNEFGFTKGKIDELSNEVLLQVKALFENMVEEEMDVYLKKKNRVKKYKADLAQLCLELDEQVNELSETFTLLQKEKILRARLDDLLQKKQDRIEKYEQMQKIEDRLCGVLGMPAKNQTHSAVPKEKELCELEQRIHNLSDEKERRYHKYWAAKNKLSTILEETDFVPETAVDREIICYEEEDEHVLSQQKLDQLHEVLSKVEEFQQKMVSDIEELSKILDILWNQLNIDEKTRENFKAKYFEYRRSTVVALKREIERCKELKIKLIRKRINELRKELMDLWQKCFLSSRQKCQFEPFYSENYSEELLNLHEIEVRRLKQYYDDTRDIFKKINKRQELWDMMLLFERKACDPSRFNNRGGNLLKEEKERNKLLKDLPALEDEILQDIGKYEERKDALFLVDGVNFSEYIKKKWDGHQKGKENRKLERQKQHSVKMNLGLPRRTLVKGPVFSAPSSAPGKLVNNKADLCPSVKKVLTPKKLPAQLCTKNMGTVKRPLFTSRSTKQKAVAEKNNVNIKHLSSTSHDTTSYDDFAFELGKDYRKHYRSTFASKQKVLGSKIYLGSSLKKSLSSSNNSSSSSHYGSKTVPRSNKPRSKCRTPTKETPVRGKLGLPFLL